MKNFCLFLMAMASFLFPSCAKGQANFDQRPRLVVGIVVDQMRWDYLSRYYTKFGTDGFRRLLDKGYSCNNTMIPYIPSVTAAGHTCIYTGSVPAINGIAGNNFYKNGKKVYCCDDDNVQTVGSNTDAGKMSPENLWVTTIGDQLRLHTDFKSKTIGVSLKDRASILPAGRTANAAYWFDTKAGKFITSTWYMKQLPQWANDYNKSIKIDKGLDVRYSPKGNELIAGIAEAALKGEKLGQNDETDFLAVSFSCTDYVGHKYGTRGEHTDEIYLTLDKQIAGLLNALDAQVGSGNYLVFLTADHGASHNAFFLQDHKVRAGEWNEPAALKDMNAFTTRMFGQPLVKDIIEYRVYLDHDAMKAANLDADKVSEALAAHIAESDSVAYAVPFDKVCRHAIPEAIAGRIVNGYNAKRSGDIQVITSTQFYDGDGQRDGGTTHGMWNPYDTHIPLLFYGWHVPQGSTTRETHMTDIAATVCAMLHIQQPNGCIGQPISFE